MSGTPAQTHLYPILARKAPIGLILRRGPSKQVLLIKWDLRKDTFEYGQWFKGRIYEGMSDLSPSGQKFIYFAGKYDREPRNWTAISRPPYLTALAIWPQPAPNGAGGVFLDEDTVLINDYPYEIDDTRKPEWPTKFKVRTTSREKFPYLNIWSTRMEREGWRQTGEGRLVWTFDKPGSSPYNLWQYSPPAMFRKPLLARANSPVLEMQVLGCGKVNGPHIDLRYVVFNQGTEPIPLLGAEWADWAENADLLYASGGKLFRLSPSGPQRRDYDPAKAREIADFSGLRFEDREAPEWARKWK